jgi:hypothetical protein
MDRPGVGDADYVRIGWGYAWVMVKITETDVLEADVLSFSMVGVGALAALVRSRSLVRPSLGSTCGSRHCGRRGRVLVRCGSCSQLARPYDRWGHERAQCFDEAFRLVGICHERPGGALVAEQEADLAGLSGAQLRA